MNHSYDDTDATLCEGTLDENTIDEDDGPAVTPLSSDFYSSNDSTPKKKTAAEKSKLSKRKFTPKQKRQLAKERYQTYTIPAENLESSQQPDEEVPPAMEEWQQPASYTRTKLTPKQRRQGDKSRFETQVLSTTPKYSMFTGIPSPSGKSGKSIVQAKEEEDKESYSAQTSSDSDSSEGHVVPKGPRIVKPGEKKETVSEPVTPEPEPRGIRGRRKPLYSSARRPKPAQQSSPTVSRSNSSPIVRQTRTLALRQSNALQKIGSQSSNQAQKKAPQTQIRSPQQFGSPSRVPAPTTFQRQGTFTKEDPRNQLTKVTQSSSAQSSRIPSPRNSAPSTPTAGMNGAKQLGSFDQSGIPRRLSLGVRSSNNGSFTPPNAAISCANSAAIKESKSKIASLFRKVESLTKQQQQNPQSDKQWITGVNRAATLATFNKRNQPPPREKLASNIRTNI